VRGPHRFAVGRLLNEVLHLLFLRTPRLKMCRGDLPPVRSVRVRLGVVGHVWRLLIESLVGFHKEIVVFELRRHETPRRSFKLLLLGIGRKVVQETLFLLQHQLAQAAQQLALALLPPLGLLRRREIPDAALGGGPWLEVLEPRGTVARLSDIGSHMQLKGFRY